MRSLVIAQSKMGAKLTLKCLNLQKNNQLNNSLQANHTKLFKPELPEAKISAIKSIGFGRSGKIFLEYEKPFWPEGKFIYSAISSFGVEVTFFIFTKFCVITLLKSLSSAVVLIDQKSASESGSGQTKL